MKKIVIGCGAGLATSTMVSSKVQEFLKEENIEAQITQSQLYELGSYDKNSDLFITTMKIDDKQFETPVVLGTAFLTGINVAEAKEQILKILKEGN